MVKRFFVFMVVNIAILISLMTVVYIFGLNRYFEQVDGVLSLNYTILAAFSLVWGFSGAFISLWMSKWMVKRLYRIRLIEPNTTNKEAKYILQKVYKFASMAGLKSMPEVGIYESLEVNAFATGSSRNNSLVAVSSAMLTQMNKEEVDGVLAHEVAHIANGDMVTMTLVQGIINSFVIFLAKAVAFAVATFLSRNDDRRDTLGSRGVMDTIVYYVIELALIIVFSIIGSMIANWYSRKREFRADYGGAQLAGKKSIVAALKKLHHIQMQIEAQPQRRSWLGRGSHNSRRGERAENYRHREDHSYGLGKGDEAIAAFKISGKSRRNRSMMYLFSTHPPLEDRIAALSQNFGLQ